MRIEEMFQKNVERDIKGVIKVGQDETSNIFEELEEYVVTKELLGHFGELFKAYGNSINKNTDKMGVWISGFFGSGKSHFLKILSYLLENRIINGKKSIEYFQDKIYDLAVLKDMKQAGDIKADTILFNIDSKSDSDSKGDKDSIVKVFNKVFNEMQGLCGSIPWVADLERQMTQDGLYEEFKRAFEKISGNRWEDSRENFYYEEDAIVEALSKTTKMSEEAARNWYKRAEENYSLSVEKFAHRVNEYIGSRGEDHHVIFLVDEIGQYIGEDSKLMLNLQTVVENLGTYCGGKAWVIVTSQQDIDASTKASGNDFSKIQGRFNTRLSLSSRNVDEVIKKRLLQKTKGSADSLKLLYGIKSSILKNLINFSSDTAEMKTYENETEFVEVYPFVPYQFNLLQSVFAGIRIHGASGKHLSEGERSLLSSFKEAAIKYVGEEMGALIPFLAFYDTMEGFLDGDIKDVIIQGKNNSGLTEEDLEVLKLLFMLKYVKEVPSNLENISTLLVKNIDDDKLEIKKKVLESLEKLLRENLIEKNGEKYIFLIREEQYINNEIKNMSVDMGEVIQKTQEIIFGEIYTDKKFRYSPKYDFSFNSIIDNKGKISKNNEIGIRIITPYFDSRVELTPEELKLMSGREKNVIVKLSGNTTFLEELEELLKIQGYLRVRLGTPEADIMESIKTRKFREVRERKERIKTLLLRELKGADIYVNASLLDIKEKNPVDRINDGFRVLIEVLYKKLYYVKTFVKGTKDLYEIYSDNNSEITSIEDEPNKLAFQEVQEYIERNTGRNIPLNMKNIYALYSNSPFGWTEIDIVAIIIKLFKAQKIRLELNREYLSITDENIINCLTKKDYIDKVLVKKKIQAPSNYISNVKEIGKDLFNYSKVLEDEDALMNRFIELGKGEVESIRELLVNYDKANYPGKDILLEGMRTLNKVIDIKDIGEFYKEAYDLKDDFLDYADYSEEVKKFFENQKSFFDEGLKQVEIYNKNKTYVLDKEAIDIIEKIEEIVSSKEPYSNIPKLKGLVEEFSNKFQALLEEECEPIRMVIESDYEKVKAELNIYNQEDELSKKFKNQFDELLNRLQNMENFYEAIAMKEESHRLKMISFDEISKKLDITSKTKNVSISSILNGTQTIKSSSDIEALLADMRKKLEEELEENTVIRLI